MNLSIIREYLEGRLDPKELHNAISRDVLQFKRRKEMKESTLPIAIAGYGNWRLTLGHIQRLCTDYLSGILDAVSIEYLANALEMTETVEKQDEEIEEILNFLANPEINYSISPELVSSIYSWTLSTRDMELSKYITLAMRK